MTNLVSKFSVNSRELEVLESAQKIFGTITPLEAGSWKNYDKMTVIGEAGFLYSSSIFKPETLPSSFSKITEVNWDLNISGVQADLKIYLCDIHQSPGWLDISNRLSGTTTAFNNRCANHNFKLYFYVLGSGKLEKPILANLAAIEIIWA